MVQERSLIVHPISGKELKNVEKFGEQDPYLKFGTDLKEPKSFGQTEVHKDAGLYPRWEPKAYTFNLRDEDEYLYVEVMDEEKGADSLIGFAAIPLRQVRDSHSASINGIFDVFYTDEKKAGEINLKLVILGYEKSSSNVSDEPIRGVSTITQDHLHRAKGISRREKLGDAATFLGGAAAIGAGLFGGKKAFDAQQHKAQDADAQQQ